jgi:CheY-like chemotaxis protein
MSSTRRVLLIEHDAAVRASLAQSLVGGGAEVILASDGADGLARLEAGAAPAVVLVDLRQPGCGGEAFVAAVRSDPRFADVPVITMAAEGGARSRREAAPFDVDDVLAIVLSLCEPDRRS